MEEEHVSVSYSDENVMPTWDDLVRVRALAWADDLEVVQVLPAVEGAYAEPYVNARQNCLHLRRMR